MRTSSLTSSALHHAAPAQEELRLAAELARLMRRAPRPYPRPKARVKPAVRRPIPPGSTREALATLLERHANPLTPSRRPQAVKSVAAPDPAEFSARIGEDGSSPPPYATAWLQRSRRQRARARLAEAVSWSLTITVGALFVAVAVWVLLGWPEDLGTSQRLGALEPAAATHPRL